MTTGSKAVDAMVSINITGNVTPQIWYKNILRDNGKPHLLAITILSEIVYWYRPQEVRDEVTGQLVGIKKRFKDDMLQRSYEQFAQQYGESKRSVAEAVTRLESIGVIKRDFRTITVNGVKCSNVLYIDLIPDKLFELTFKDFQEQQHPPTKKRDRGNTSDAILPHVRTDSDIPLSQNFVGGGTKFCDTSLQKNVIGRAKFCDTNTEINTENTTKIILTSSTPPVEMQEEEDTKNRIRFDRAKKEYPDIADAVLKELNDTSLTSESFYEICKTIATSSKPIRNISAYIRACIKNMAAGQQIRKGNTFGQHMKADYDIGELEKLLTI